MNRIHKYKIYSKGHLRRLAKIEADSYSFRTSLLQAQTLPCSSTSSMNIDIECNKEIIEKMRNTDDKIAFISPNEDNINDISQSNLIEHDVLLHDESLEAISTDNNNLYSESLEAINTDNNNLSETMSDVFK